MTEYKSYGYIRTFFYTTGFIGGALVWGILLLALARFIPFLRLLGRYLWLDLAVILVAGFLTAFWLVNQVWIIPTQIFLSSAGFITRTPNRQEHELFARWSELVTVQNILVGTYITVRANNGSFYRFIFPLDTDGYRQLIIGVRSEFGEHRSRQQQDK